MKSATRLPRQQNRLPLFCRIDNRYHSFCMTNSGKVLRIILGERFLVIAGPADITREQTDAIVNAANSSLLGGGGVDGAIHRAGGPAILEACQQIVARIGRLPAGQAVATPAGRLNAKYVIHTVGPFWGGGARGEAETLASCHRQSIRVADELQLASIAFPAISTGAYGYPADQAAHIAVGSAAEALTKATHVREVRFVLFDSKTFEHYAKAAQAFGKPVG
ncbi:MAG TPA: O-acetyl-ADP-ribose deacetylase [Terriglobales bacterium]|nr:O-acetyl-ADP-ribose deacetylase [Terriglobales bacterium]